MATEPSPGAEKAAKPPIETLGQLIGTALAYFVMGLVALAIIDLVFSMPTGGEFGQVSGWVAALPTVFVFTEQFRRYVGGSRWALMLVCVALALGVGLAAAVVLPQTWAPMAVGGIGGLMAAVTYAVLWHAGIKTFGEERPQ
ncbi:hypothetical protein [Glycomyces buryatensis]|uniref:hypothetical protein n=1 Tax=Glycomyces buryatensis TaxID=2570927 RepID=UPI0014562970|nr:hypothetical protein [Glycomyces buryatensis]